MQVATNVPSSPNLVTLMMGALSSTEKSVLTRATRRNTPENGFLHSHRRENLKSSNIIVGPQIPTGYIIWLRSEAIGGLL
jgi:hypothetical protein